MLRVQASGHTHNLTRHTRPERGFPADVSRSHESFRPPHRLQFVPSAPQKMENLEGVFVRGMSARHLQPRDLNGVQSDHTTGKKHYKDPHHRRTDGHVSHDADVAATFFAISRAPRFPPPLLPISSTNGKVSSGAGGVRSLPTRAPLNIGPKFRHAVHSLRLYDRWSRAQVDHRQCVGGLSRQTIRDTRALNQLSSSSFCRWCCVEACKDFGQGYD